MHLAHSNIVKEPVLTPVKPMGEAEQFAHDMAVKQYRKACKKFEKEISLIREYFPGYMPAFNK